MPDDARVFMLSAEPPLPPDVASALADRVRWLREAVIAIDAELGLTYPAIEIVPVFWLHELADGTEGNVPARVSLRQYQSSNVFAVQITAAALLEYDDDLLRGILAHEFLHVVHKTLHVADRLAGDGDDGGAGDSIATNDYAQSMADYRRIDASLLADPKQWLSPGLARLAEAIGGDNPRVDAALLRIKSNWIGRGLPVAYVSLVCEGRGITVDTAIVEKAARLRREPDADGRGATGSPR